ncbi:hypothetical protein JHK87_007096 [Glycine soja]|nr:hypothetical protein JHK87_007096 [Glycine soja]
MLGMAETKATTNVILEELEGKGEEGDTVGEGEAATRVPVVRLRIGEVAKVSSMVLLSVFATEEKEILEACIIRQISLWIRPPPYNLLYGSILVINTHSRQYRDKEAPELPESGFQFLDRGVDAADLISFMLESVFMT